LRKFRPTIFFVPYLCLAVTNFCNILSTATEIYLTFLFHNLTFFVLELKWKRYAIDSKTTYFLFRHERAQLQKSLCVSHQREARKSGKSEKTVWKTLSCRFGW
jgi:hypothetical protein